MQKGGWHQVWLPTLRRSSDLRWLKAQPLLFEISFFIMMIEPSYMLFFPKPTIAPSASNEMIYRKSHRISARLKILDFQG